MTRTNSHTLTICLAISLLFAANVGRGAEGWINQRDPDFGFSYSLPGGAFKPVQGDRPSFYYYSSPETGAKFMVGAWRNDGKTPSEFKNWMLTHIGGYEEVTYRPGGRSWFVLSGYRDDQIYYEKVIFSCGGRVASAFALVYPDALRKRFDPVVERVEDTFQKSRNCD